MRVLDLCTEFGSETAAFRDRGHEVVLLGIEGNVDIKCDVRQYYPSIDDKYDMVFAHPPCIDFTLLKRIKCKDRTPDMSIVWACQRIITSLEPRFWLIENPRACLRYFLGKPAMTIYYSEYGCRWRKPTDLWGHLPFFWSEAKRQKISSCAWDASVSNQSHHKAAQIRALVPYGLSLAICKAIERELEEVKRCHQDS